MGFSWGGIQFDDSGNPLSSTGVFNPNQSNWLPNYTNTSGNGIGGNMGGFLSGGGIGGFDGGGTNFNIDTNFPTGSGGGSSGIPGVTLDPATGSGDTGSLDDIMSLFGIPGTSGIKTSDALKTLGGILGTIFHVGGGSGSNQTKIDPATGKPVPQQGSDLISQILGMLGVAGPGIYGAIQAQNQQDWNNSSKISTLNYLQQQGGNAQKQADAAQAGYLPAMLAQLQTSQGRTNDLQSALQGNLSGAISNAPGAFNGVTDPSRVPGTAELMQYLQGLQGTGGNALNNLQGNLAGGPLSQGLQTATGLSTGQNPYAKQLEGIAGGLTSGLGSTAFQPNGATQQASSVAANILAKNPLLSMDQIKSMATDQNARQSINSANTLRRQLLDRTGVTGPSIASGQQNELLGSLQDQGLQNQASGLTQAVLGQQGLQSSLFGQGANLYGSSQGAANQQGQLDLSKILGGAGLLSGTQGLNISALNALANLAGTQNQGYGTLGSLLGTLTGTGVAGQNAAQGLQNFGLQSQNDLYSQLNNLYQNQGNLANQTQTGLFNSANYPQNTYNDNLNFLQSLATNNTGLFGGNVAPTNFFAGIKA